MDTKKDISEKQLWLGLMQKTRQTPFYRFKDLS